ncbi:MAG: AAA family ATPase [Methanotrichaceae archaeon]
MKIIGFVGMPGSGKSVAAEVASQMKIPVVVMGDVIREEAARQGLEPTDQNLGKIGKLLREHDGACAVAERCLQKIQASNSNLVVVEGMRSKDEIDLFRESSQDFCLVEIWVPDDIRLRRIRLRGRSDDANESDLEVAVAKRDRRELGWGMKQAIKSANLRISNASSQEEFRKKIEKLLRKYSQDLD